MASKTGSFINRNFLLLVQGSWVNQVGTQMALIATSVWLRQSTNSASLIGLTAAATALPLLLFSPLGGVFADRWFRRNSLILWDVFCACVSCGMMFAVGSKTLQVGTGVAAIFTGMVFLSSANAFTSPAFNALIPDVVPAAQLTSAMAFTQASSLIAIIVGQAAGGILVGRFSTHILFGFDAATYLFSALAECFVRVPAFVRKLPRNGNGIAAIYHDVREGLQYVGQRAGMRALLLAAIPMNVFITPIFVFLPFYTTNALGAPVSTYGYLLATFSLGLLTGYGMAGKLPIAARRIAPLLFGCVTGNALICIALSVIQWYWLAAALLFVLGCCSGMVTLLSMNVLISRTDADMRGRISAILVMITQGLTPLIVSLIGVIGDLLHRNVRPLYGSCGVALLLVGARLFSNLHLRGFLEGAPHAE